MCSGQIGRVPPHRPPCLSRFFCFSWCLNPIFLYATRVLERGHREDRDDGTRCWPRTRATDFASTGDTHRRGSPSLSTEAAKKSGKFAIVTLRDTRQLLSLFQNLQSFLLYTFSSGRLHELGRIKTETRPSRIQPQVQVDHVFLPAELYTS